MGKSYSGGKHKQVVLGETDNDCHFSASELSGADGAYEDLVARGRAGGGGPAVCVRTAVRANTSTLIASFMALMPIVAENKCRLAAAEIIFSEQIRGVGLR